MDRRKQTNDTPKSTPRKNRSDRDALEMTSCATCGAWVSVACERPDCPIE
jgi:hypothetical protein